MDKLQTKQDAIDEGWRLYNVAMESLEELNTALERLLFDHDVNTDKASTAAYLAHETLETAYSTGSLILPPHSNDK